MFGNAIKYERRLKDFDANTILHQCVTENHTMKRKNCWQQNITSILQYSTQNNLILNDNIDIDHSDVIYNLQTMLKNWWHIKLFDDTKSPQYGNKLRTYRLYKDQFQKEEYLNILPHKVQRCKMTQLRLSCHKLEIEVGRYMNKKDRLPPSLRTCKLCNLKTCEDEQHFISECPLYNKVRHTFMIQAADLFPFCKDLSGDTLLIWLLGNKDEKIIILLSKFIEQCFTMRKDQLST